MLRLSLILVAILTAAVARADGTRPASSIAPGKYCIDEPITGSTGTGHDVELGTFRMIVEVTKVSDRYGVSISNQMPDNPQILAVETKNATVLHDGSLAFPFTDGWNNEGRARVSRNGSVTLEMTKGAPMNQIGRNYGTFRVSRSKCAGVAFR